MIDRTIFVLLSIDNFTSKKLIICKPKTMLQIYFVKQKLLLHKSKHRKKKRKKYLQFSNFIIRNIIV